MLKASVLLLSGLALVKLFGSDSAWKEVTEVACTKNLTDSCVRKIVGLMAKCESISPVQEEALKHPFVQFWMRLANTQSLVARQNIEVLRSDALFMNEAMRLCENLDRSQSKALQFQF